ncbi:hypothetical protein ATE47_16110 [Chryseobacterium sp. IHB B 17019]|jgi:hypothetical protein|uniref:hypothetical protein n=1 Tax=Chryseobacterium sp. IHB B 17019 TaxID=1721091 RepID=UPI0007223BB2|nr:hypothetical protein [Chryseobacterium sp. IHB B 17019]ALR31945.1 hypothetical protein ATE47_16110 [Chryseobacterium sp. IHB B 17019]
MIEKIEFSVEGQTHTNIYNREEYSLYLERSKKEDLGIHKVKTWVNDGKIVVPEYLGGTPSYFWDSIVKIIDPKSIIILNSDASTRFIVQVPELIQLEEYEKYFGKNTFFKREDYSTRFVRIDDYFKFENKFYNILIIALENKNNPFDAYLQQRYFDPDKGEFLPFTKCLIRRTPNRYSYTEEIVNI